MNRLKREQKDKKKKKTGGSLPGRGRIAIDGS
jgi:hypothetical protein